MSQIWLCFNYTAIQVRDGWIITSHHFICLFLFVKDPDIKVHWANTGPRWAPCWFHKFRYLGRPLIKDTRITRYDNAHPEACTDQILCGCDMKFWIKTHRDRRSNKVNITANAHNQIVGGKVTTTNIGVSPRHQQIKEHLWKLVSNSEIFIWFPIISNLNGDTVPRKKILTIYCHGIGKHLGWMYKFTLPVCP